MAMKSSILGDMTGISCLRFGQQVTGIAGFPSKAGAWYLKG